MGAALAADDEEDDDDDAASDYMEGDVEEDEDFFDSEYDEKYLVRKVAFKQIGSEYDDMPFDISEYLPVPGESKWDRSDLRKLEDQLLQTNLFADVKVDFVTGAERGIPDGQAEVLIKYGFDEIGPKVKGVKFLGAENLPEGFKRSLLEKLRKEDCWNWRTQRIAEELIENWYKDHGYVFAYVSEIDHVGTGLPEFRVCEHKVSNIEVQFYDEDGNVRLDPYTNPDVVLREIPDSLKPGNAFNLFEIQRFTQNLVLGVGCIENIQVQPQMDGMQLEDVALDLIVLEKNPKTVELELDWSIAPNEAGRLGLATLQPGGSIYFEHSNLGGQNRSLYGSVSCQNLINPQEELGFKLEYNHPYIYGTDDPKKSLLKVAAFNGRKISAVYQGGPLVDEVPMVWVDRAGVKATVTENFTKQTRATYGVVLEEVNTRDDQGSLVTHGARVLPNGTVNQEGPPTTLSGTGTDRVAFLQGNLTRDATSLQGTSLTGARDVLTVEQGLFLGSGKPFFNRHVLSSTRFIPLKDLKHAKAQESLPTLVLHGKFGNTIGDLPNYDVFTLGGPYSVRAYNFGELAACRRFLETAAEVRYPLTIMGKQKTTAYAFAEYGTDLGSSKEVSGNPTEYFRRPGSGACWGAGLKLGPLRAEYAVDGNARQGTWFVKFGERF